MKRKTLLLVTLVLCVTSIFAEDLKPLNDLVNTRVQNFQSSSRLRVPIISWGADMLTIYANGNKARTASGSLFANKGLNIELYREDDFKNQVDRFLKGEIVYLRGTMGMINAAAAVTENDPRTKLVVVYQHSWSSGGDALVVKGNIKSVADLKGKTIALQAYGPHVDYFIKLLEDANLSVKDVTIIWTDGLVGPEGDTPMAQLYKSSVDAAFVIIPDALALTSNGTVGTGAEESVRGAKILISTKTANRIISDVYAVRKDYFDANTKAVQSFVNALFQAQEEVKELYQKKDKTYSTMLEAGAALILDDGNAVADMEAMAYLDAELVGYNGNVKFFDDPNNLRNFEKLNKEIQNVFIDLGLLSGTKSISKADWNYRDLAQGLSNISAADTSRFNEDVVSTTISRKQQQGSIDDSALFSLEIFFKPNQNSFSADLYTAEFDEILELAAAYGGAVITVEGHSDPMGYLRREKAGAGEVELKRIRQAAKNLSYSRANAVRDTIVEYALSRGIYLDPGQFAIVGYGISKPTYSIPTTEDQWLANMRVEFKIIQIEAEADAFVPLF